MDKALGKKFLKCGARVLCAIFKQVPGVGAAVEVMDDFAQTAEKLQAEQQLRKLEERLQQLEEATHCTQDEVVEIVDEVWAEEQKAKATGRNPADIAAGRQDLANTADSQQAPADIADAQQAPADIADAQQARADSAIKEAVKDRMLAMPDNIARQIRATISYSRRQNKSALIALPIGDDPNIQRERLLFYHRLFPQRCPQYKTGDTVPNRLSWKFEGMLGIGGFGEVWQIQHNVLHQTQALKLCLDPESSKILKKEASILAELQDKLSHHENIVAVLDANTDITPYWIAFEYIDGGTLENYIQSFCGPMPLEEAIPLFTQICLGMKSAHEHKIVHRDLKPANILLTPDCTPKIADFGLGKIIIEQAVRLESAKQSLTLRGYGSLGYMSYEQRQFYPADPTDDVYSLGVILYQMLIGKPNQEPQYVENYLKKLKPLPPSEIISLVCNCINNPREERIQSAKHLLDVLTEACQKNNLAMFKPRATKYETSIKLGESHVAMLTEKIVTQREMFKKDKAEQEAKLKIGQDKIATQQHQITAQQNQITAQQNQITAQQNQLKKLSEQSIAEQKKLKELAQFTTAEQKKLDTARQEFQKINQEISQVNQKLAGAKKELADAQKQLAEQKSVAQQKPATQPIKEQKSAAPQKSAASQKSAGEEFYSFEQVLKELCLEDEELRRLVAEGEIRAFRDGGKMKFRRTDIDGLKRGSFHEPKIILPSSDTNDEENGEETEVFVVFDEDDDSNDSNDESNDTKQAGEEFYSFEQVLKELLLEKDDLKRLVAEGEIRALRDGDKIKFYREDIDDLKFGKR